MAPDGKLWFIAPSLRRSWMNGGKEFSLPSGVFPVKMTLRAHSQHFQQTVEYPAGERFQPPNQAFQVVDVFGLEVKSETIRFWNPAERSSHLPNITVQELFESVKAYEDLVRARVRSDRRPLREHHAQKLLKKIFVKQARFVEVPERWHHLPDPSRGLSEEETEKWNDFYEEEPQVAIASFAQVGEGSDTGRIIADEEKFEASVAEKILPGQIKNPVILKSIRVVTIRDLGNAGINADINRAYYTESRAKKNNRPEDAPEVLDITEGDPLDLVAGALGEEMPQLYDAATDPEDTWIHGETIEEKTAERMEIQLSQA